MSANLGGISREYKVLAVFLALVVILALVLAASAAAPRLVSTPPPVGGSSTESGSGSLAYLFIAFAAGTLIIFGILFVFAALGRWISGNDASERGALSLPHGSISAVLALIIVVVFSVTSIHVYSELRAGEDVGIESAGVTQEALDALPRDRVLHIAPETAMDGQPATYTVTLANPHENSTVFAGDLMTIFSTLLIAIVGFYFGQGATAAGVREAEKLKLGKNRGGTTAIKDTETPPSENTGG